MVLQLKLHSCYIVCMKIYKNSPNLNVKISALFLIIFAAFLVNKSDNLYGWIWQTNSIKKYRRTFYRAHTEEGQPRIVLRTWQQNGHKKTLSVDPVGFKTFIEDGDTLKEERQKPLGTTPYEQALTLYTKAPYKAHNHGLAHVSDQTEGSFLTIDMCPSSKPLAKDLFEAIAMAGEHEAVPIGISMTGLWAKQHPKELVWLIKQQDEQKLAITWINHTFHHNFIMSSKAKRWLLPSQHTEMEEILLLEKMLIQKGQVPSVFFRFPGLMANAELIKTLHEAGLIPLGSDAWLAKRQHATPGSIILVHGNGNETAGVHMLGHMLIEKSTLKLRSLPEGVAHMMAVRAAL